MKTAYNEKWLLNLHVVKSAKEWLDSNLVSREEYDKIADGHHVGFFHPNMIIRLLLFIAGLVALLGVTGLLVLGFDSVSGDTVSILALIYGLLSFVVLEVVVINGMNHYKSGVTEALLYHSIAFVVGGIAGISEGDKYAITLSCLVLFTFSAYRYLDLVSTGGAFLSLSYLLFSLLFDAGGLAGKVIPFVFIAGCIPIYFLFKKLRARVPTELWEYCLILAECLSLLIVYVAGNYYVVRELSVEMTYLEIDPNDDIPFAFLFYAFTVIIPVVYLYFGIKKKDQLMLRVSLIVVAFSVFTFKYYFSLGHHEITLTVAGAFLVIVAVLLLRFLREPKNGFTREQLRREKWADSNPEAFVISQTMGGNTAQSSAGGYKGEGGSFGGGGASGNY